MMSFFLNSHKLLILIFLFSSHFAQALEKSLKADPKDIKPTQFMIYFQPLFELPETEVKNYILKLHEIISQNDSIQFETLLVGQNPKCQKRQQKSCHPTLYFNDVCVPPKQRASLFCRNKMKRKIDYFKEPVFNRIDWNKLALTINEFCNKNLTPVCRKLSLLHLENFKKYRELLKQRKKLSED